MESYPVHLLAPRYNTPLQRCRVPPLLPAAAQYNGDYALTYALLLSGASKSSATSAFSSNRCGYKQTEDQRAALTAALLLAFGADGSESKGMLQSAYTNREWKGGKCVKPDGGRAGASRFCEYVMGVLLGLWHTSLLAWHSW